MLKTWFNNHTPQKAKTKEELPIKNFVSQFRLLEPCAAKHHIID
jgi:hypothetical protein